jgi:hypothetical protein
VQNHCCHSPVGTGPDNGVKRTAAKSAVDTFHTTFALTECVSRIEILEQHSERYLLLRCFVTPSLMAQPLPHIAIRQTRIGFPCKRVEQ